MVRRGRTTGADGQGRATVGARRVVATTHGHEVGWSMVPLARQCLRLIGNNADVITYISDYTQRRLRGAFGPHPEWAHLPSGVSLDSLSPQPLPSALRQRRSLG